MGGMVVTVYGYDMRLGVGECKGEVFYSWVRLIDLTCADRS